MYNNSAQNSAVQTFRLARSTPTFRVKRHFTYYFVDCLENKTNKKSSSEFGWFIFWQLRYDAHNLIVILNCLEIMAKRLYDEGSFG